MSAPVTSQTPRDTGDEDDDRDDWFTAPIHPDDRLWRHPAEVAAGLTPGGGTPAITVAPAVKQPSPVAITIIAGLVGATLAVGAVALLGGFDDSMRVREQIAVRSMLDDGLSGVTALAEAAGPSVVAVNGDSRGSGIVFRSDGSILTTASVVGTARTVEVLVGGETATTAKVVGVDASTDIAVVRVKDLELEPATLGSADGLDVGASILSMGAAETWGSAQTVTTGVVTAKGKRLQVGADDVFVDMVVVDAPLAPGGVGGPVLDAGGAVVGLSHAMQLDGDNRLSIATPIDHAIDLADDLLDHGRIHHAWLGVESADLTVTRATDTGLAGGAEVKRLFAGGPAAAGGLQIGDVIVAVDGQAIDSVTDLLLGLRDYEPGDPVAIDVIRNGAEISVACTLTERP